MPAYLAALLVVAPALALASACGGADSAHDPDGEGGAGGAACTPIVPNGRGGIPPAPPGAALCTDGACNYQTQEGCTADEACRPQFPAGSTTVRPGCESAGEAAVGEACMTSADCVRGALCAENVCRTQCCGGDWSACDAGESCIRQFVVRFDDHTEHALDFCVPVNNCDIFDPDSCADPTRECKIVDPTGAVACAPRSTRQLGDSCAPPDVCAQGLTCVGEVCIALCRVEACGEPGCADGEECVHFDRDPPGVGECTPE